ncbi:MFS transporter [Corallococcus interemptor]|uniref:MFS transporter n=1 Tax=Corallococcus interemptor TaxID=2316720 RepID=UPI0035D46E55
MNPINATAGAGPGSTQVPYAKRWPALFVLLAAWFMNLLDVSIMNVALPSLQAGLQASDSAIQWVLEIYILTYALCLLPFGRLGDIVGRKGMFATGVGVFTAASVLCGAAPSADALIAARGLQGLGAAMMSPQVMAIAQTMFPPKDRARAFPLFGLTAGLAAISGPLASGLLLHANFFDLGWRLIFLVNLPIGLLTIAAALVLVPRSPQHEGLRNDWLGIGLAGAAILCLIFPLVEGRTHGWPLWCFLAMAAFAPLLVAFVAWQRFLAKRGGSALLPVYLMSNRDYLIGAGAILVYCAALQGFFVIFAIFLQVGLQFTPLQAGLATAPFPVGVLAATIVSGRIASLKAKILGGALLLMGAFGALPLIVENGGGHVGSQGFAVPLFLGGLGAGMCIASLFQTVMRTVPLKDAGSGSGAVQVIQQVGGALGVALVSAIFFSQVGPRESLGSHVQDAFRRSFNHTSLFFVGAFLVVAASALALKIAGPGAAFIPAPAPQEPRP